MRDQPVQIQIIKISGYDPDWALTALLEYFNLLAHALKVHSCYLSSYHLASLNTDFYIEITYWDI